MIELTPRNKILLELQKEQQEALIEFLPGEQILNVKEPNEEDRLLQSLEDAMNASK